MVPRSLPVLAAAVLLVVSPLVPQLHAGTSQRPDVTDPLGDHANTITDWDAQGGAHEEFATPEALDGSAAWFDYFLAESGETNQEGAQFKGLVLVGLRVRSLDPRAKMGAYEENAGWVARVTVNGDDHAVATYRWNPCVRGSPTCLDGLMSRGQPWVACKNGEPQDLGDNPLIQYDGMNNVIKYGLQPALAGDPEVGTVVENFHFEVRRFPEGQDPRGPPQGFGCPIGGALIDRIPDRGGAACRVTDNKRYGCERPLADPGRSSRAIEVKAPSSPSFVQRSVDHDRETSVDVEVENIGDFPEVVRVRAEGPPGWEVSVSPERFPLTRPGHGGAKRGVSVSVSPPDTADPDQVARFRLFAETESGEEDRGSFPVQVVPRREEHQPAAASVAVAESSLEALPGQPVRFIVELTNELEESQTVRLQVSSPMQGWAEIQAPGGDKMTLGPGETGQAYLVVTPPADAAPGQAAQFRISAKPSAGDAVSTQVELTVASGGEVAGSSSLQESAGAMMTAMGLGALAPSGIFGLLLLVLLILVVLLLLFGRREREVVEVEEAEEPDE